ncbi:MAG: 3-hydroxyacyl-CoA dehydrogenase family protein [Gemmatimonadetes bacterium]|nr:3-hydroxyacyl-CoA dehydrogenase family protein [Gemmatimonadota bacterium]
MDLPGIFAVAVIGAGTMGSGIAGMFARAGCHVRLVDLSDALLDRAIARLRLGQEALVEAGLLLPRDAHVSMERVIPTTDLAEACDGSDFLLEAVTEDLALKQELFAAVDGLCPRETVLATNTSGLSVTAIARATGRPDRVGGMHFWNPPHLVPLVEVIRADTTSDDTAERLKAVALRLNRKPIMVRRDIPGFVGNRLQFAVMREALHLLREGVASAEDIDTAMTAGPGLRYSFMGPLRTADLGGLDVFRAISSYLFASLSVDREAPETLHALVEAGKLGAKSGSGFYRYSDADLGRFIRRRDRILLKLTEVLEAEEDVKDG